MVLTGASSGLGARFARVLDAVGATLVLAARRRDRLDALAGECREAIPVECDLSDPAQCARLVDVTVHHFGRVDVLINNAGITNLRRCEDEELDDVRRVVEIDLIAPFILAQRCARVMIKAGMGGTIVNVASVLGHVGVGQIPQASYAAAKGDLVNLSRELAAQWARNGVRVNVLAPGWFPSELTSNMFDDETSMRWLAKRTPMGRTGSINELDGALLFLASDASSYTTGTGIIVDGGWTAI